ncbi:MAG: DUF342 domain-containing protein, partial [Fretibacterium sp.]|nr:DUF342 domain-containing protein [Fretibacterium sp.]
DVHAKNALLHSTVSAQNSVTVMGGQKSQIAGGKIEAGLEVSCHILGSEMGTKTEVLVGLPPALLARKRELQEQATQHSDNLTKVNANLAFLKKLEMAGQLDQKKRALLMLATKTKFQLQAALEPITVEIEEINQRLEMSRSMGIVRVRDICYPGVHIFIRGVVYVVRENFKFSSFVFEEGEVRPKPFDYKP